MININCPCGEEMELTDDFAGSVCKCHACGAVIAVPEAPEPRPASAGVWNATKSPSRISGPRQPGGATRADRPERAERPDRPERPDAPPAPPTPVYDEAIDLDPPEPRGVYGRQPTRPRHTATRTFARTGAVKRKRNAPVLLFTVAVTFALAIVIVMLVVAINVRSNQAPTDTATIPTDLDTEPVPAGPTLHAPTVSYSAPAVTNTPAPRRAPSPSPKPTPAVGTPISALSPGDRTLFDFEDGSFAGWKVEGNAFGKAPDDTTLTSTKSLSNQQGRLVVHSSHGADNPQGKLTSPPFKIDHRYMRVLVAGGSHVGKTYVGLEVDGELVRSSTGSNTLTFADVLWDLSSLQGKEARFVVVDAYSGRWGMIACDRVVLTDNAAGLTPSN
ncbi:MAG: hypothetical protein GC159_05945 [Phycisphaera sp.]|nr:hypothetical protein [Phycisphaera sp.]